VYIEGLETDMKIWGTTSPSLVQLLEGKTPVFTLATLDDQNLDRVYYFSYRHSVDPAPGTSWLDTPGECTRSCISRGSREWGQQD
jgi:hypothetical protein